MTAVNAFTVRAPRTVIQSNGKTRRFVLLQPPHFRKGRDAAPAVDAVALDAVRALKNCDCERNAHYRSKGVRVITTK